MWLESIKNLLPADKECKKDSLLISEEIKNSSEAIENKKSTKENIKELSDDKLLSMNNREFLAISDKKRLQYITTKDSSKIEDILEWKKDYLEFTFTFNGKFNRELWLKTTAWQVLPEWINEVKTNWEIYSRTWLDGEFFNDSNKRLVINEWTKLEKIKVLSKEEIEKATEENTKNYDSYVKENPKKSIFSDIIFEAVSRDIDPEFAISIFSPKISKLNIFSNERRVVLEDMFTEFDRIRSWVTFWNGKQLKWDKKYPDEFVVRLVRKINPDNIKEVSKKYWIKESEVNRINSFRTAEYLTTSQRIEIINRAPEYVKALVRKYFPAWEYENALLVCNWESSFKKDAINKNTDKYSSVDRGLMQVNDRWHSDKYRWENIFDPDVNMRVAFEIYKESWNSWKPWYAARKIWLA